MLQDRQIVSNVSASTAITVIGGIYLVEVAATFGGGSVKLQRLGPDGSTYIDMKSGFDNGGTEQDDVIGTFAANGAKVLYLAPGGYQFTITTATAVYASATRVPIA